ncbi:MAG: glycosyltransferase [Paludibacter sp.]|nr:glycosyltransferase [Paludibacter sp.]
MKVLFISSWYPTENNPNFGIFIKEHASAIQSTENEIKVLAILTEKSHLFFTINKNVYVDEAGIETVEIRILTKFKNLVYHFVPLQNKIAFYFYKKLLSKSFSPDLVHSNVVFPAGMIGDFISKKIKKPHIITEHWSKIGGILKKPYLSWLTKKTYKNASKILTVSYFLKDYMISLMPALKSKKIQIIPNVINSNTFTYKQKNNSKNEIHFCSIATWATKREPDKKPELIIEALSKVQKNIEKEIILTLVGGGDRLEELEHLCKKHQLRAEFTGYQPKAKIATILHNSDFYIHASTIETFGIVIVEALMTGTPVICSNVGALPEIINESNGILCENTIEKWVEGIQLCINTSYNSKQISVNTGNRFSLEIIGSQINDAYKEL